jgi:hypothetical protein
VLAAALARSDAEPSATETLRARYDDATSLATLIPIHETLVQAADRERWTRHLQDVVLDCRVVARIVDSPAYGALVAALRAGERDGHDMTAALNHFAVPVHGPTIEDTSDLAALLHERVTSWLKNTPPTSASERLVAGLVPAADHVADRELGQSLRDIEGHITARVHTLVLDVLHRPSAWALPLGPPPRDKALRREWLDAIGVIAGYRDLHQITADQFLGAADSPDPSSSDERRRATAAAATASRLARQRTSSASITDQARLDRSIHR